jgi:hypothetical protein
MIKKRNKFWTVAFSMLPGAGHMFNGFMKLGVSLMTLFFAVTFLSVTLGIGTLMLLAPVIWFYAFFDCINKRFLDDEDFYAQEDYYLFELDKLSRFDLSFLMKHKIIIGLGLIFVGVYSLWENAMGYVLFNIGLSEEVVQSIMAFTSLAPQLIISIAVIGAGILLIRGKKQQIKEETALAEVDVKEALKEEEVI